MKKYAFALAIGLSFPASVLAECKPIECLEQAITTYKEATQRIESLETRIKELEESTDVSASSKGLIGAFLNECPDGWDHKKELQGRYLLGVGNDGGKNRERKTDNAAILRDIPPNEFGGYMNQMLLKHHHIYEDKYYIEELGKNWPKDNKASREVFDEAPVSPAQADPIGEKHAYFSEETTDDNGSLTASNVKGTNYPPYHSVYWCEKE